MNDQPGKIARLGVLFRGAALVGLLAGVSACASSLSSVSPFSPPPADPNSPVAAAANAAAKDSKHADLPRFIDIPPIPTDVRTPVQFKKAVGAEKVAADKLKPDTWTLSDTEGYASKARKVGKAPPSDIPTDADRAATEAFAKAARDRATAPPSK